MGLRSEQASMGIVSGLRLMAATSNEFLEVVTTIPGELDVICMYVDYYFEVGDGAGNGRSIAAVISMYVCVCICMVFTWSRVHVSTGHGCQTCLWSAVQGKAFSLSRRSRPGI